MRHVSFITALVLILASDGYSQATREGVFRALLFGRTHSAAGEAMGKSSIHLDNGSISHLFNPASLQIEKGFSASFSSGGRFYHYAQGEYRYFGASVNLGPRRAFAVSMKSFDTGSSLNISNGFKADIITASYAARLFWGIDAGISLKYFSEDLRRYDDFLFTPISIHELTVSLKRKSYFPEIGLMKRFIFNSSEEKTYEFRTGLSISSLSNNVARADIYYQNIEGLSGDFKIEDALFDSEMPGMLRAGAAYIYSYKEPGSDWYKFFGMKLAAEYYSMTPGDLSGYNIGCELFAFNLLYGRIGFYREFTNDTDFWYGGQPRSQRVTWGFGFRVPTERLMSTVPVELNIDYAQYGEPHKKCPIIPNYGTFRMIQLSMNYDIN